MSFHSVALFVKLVSISQQRRIFVAKLGDLRSTLCLRVHLEIHPFWHRMQSRRHNNKKIVRSASFIELAIHIFGCPVRLNHVNAYTS